MSSDPETTAKEAGFVIRDRNSEATTTAANRLYTPIPCKPSNRNQRITMRGSLDSDRQSNEEMRKNCVGGIDSDYDKSKTKDVIRDKKVESKKSTSPKLPSLNVKAEPNLKSCISMSNFEGKQMESDQLASDSDKVIHPSFLIKPDIISPNRHGLLSLNQKGTATPTGNEEFAHSHVTYTPLVASNSNSAVSSAANSPPLVTKSTSTSKSPPLIRLNSLRYSIQHDKKIIESIRQSNNNSISSNIDEQSELEQDKKLHLLIGVTGCISIKNVFLIIEKLFELYTHDKLEIQVVLTKAAEWFLSGKLHKFEALAVKVWFHDDNMKYYSATKYKYNYPSKPFPKLTSSILSQYILAYDLQKWTDVLLIAPLSANTMAKLINGLADNLLTDILHMWPNPHPNAAPQPKQQSDNTVLTNDLISPKPIIVALALTSSMYSHPMTKRQLALLQETYPNMCILKPVEKCVDVDGNISMGGMRSWGEVVDFVVKKLGEPQENDDDYDDENEDLTNEYSEDDEADEPRRETKELSKKVKEEIKECGNDAVPLELQLSHTENTRLKEDSITEVIQS